MMRRSSVSSTECGFSPSLRRNPSLRRAASRYEVELAAVCRRVLSTRREFEVQSDTHEAATPTRPHALSLVMNQAPSETPVLTEIQPVIGA